MKSYRIIFLSLLFFTGCKEKEKEKEVTDRSIIMPEIKLTPLQKTVDSALVSIVKKDIELNGETVNTIKIEGMEIIKISKKDYYTQEMNEQEINFANYLQYLKTPSIRKRNTSELVKLEDNKAKHNSVIAYLKKVIKSSSSDPQMYKVMYYLKAGTNNLKYKQQQITYLDKDFKKVESDYSFLK